MVKQYQDTRQIVADAGVSDKLAGIIQNTFRPFMEKFMDALDGQIDKNLAMVENKPWMGGAFAWTILTAMPFTGCIFLLLANNISSCSERIEGCQTNKNRTNVPVPIACHIPVYYNENRN